MEQVWLLLSLTSLATGFGLVVALLVLKRLAPVALPPVVVAVAALLLMGIASFFGVYLRILSIPRSVLPYRIVNAAAWGLAAFAMVYFVRSGLPRRPDAVEVSLGALVLAAALLAAHPPPGGLLSGPVPLDTILMVAIEVVVGGLAVWAGLRSLSRSRATSSRPWRAYLRGFGIALLLLVPANLLDFAVSVALRLRGVEAQDGFVFAAGFGIANIVLIAAIVRGIRLSSEGDVPAVADPFVDAFGITRREREVIEKLIEGKSDREIAEELFISPRTVDTHLRSVFRKCGVSSRMQLTRLVSSYGELRNSR